MNLLRWIEAFFAQSLVDSPRVVIPAIQGISAKIGDGETAEPLLIYSIPAEKADFRSLAFEFQGRVGIGQGGILQGFEGPGEIDDTALDEIESGGLGCGKTARKRATALPNSFFPSSFLD